MKIITKKTPAERLGIWHIPYVVLLVIPAVISPVLAIIALYLGDLNFIIRTLILYEVISALIMATYGLLRYLKTSDHPKRWGSITLAIIIFSILMFFNPFYALIFILTIGGSALMIYGLIRLTIKIKDSYHPKMWGSITLALIIFSILMFFNPFYALIFLGTIGGSALMIYGLIRLTIKVRDYIYSRRDKKNTRLEIKKDIINKFEIVVECLNDFDTINAKKLLDEVIIKAKSYNLKKFYNQAKIKLEECKFINDQKAELIRVREFEDLVRKAKGLVNRGSDYQSEKSYLEAIGCWNEGIKTFKLATKKASSSIEKENLEENIHLLKGEICKAYIKDGENHNKSAKKTYKERNIDSTEKEWNLARKSIQTAFDMAQVENLTVNLNNLEVNLKNINLNLERLQIEKIYNKAIYLQKNSSSNENISEARNLIEEAIKEFSIALEECDKRNEFQDLKAKINKEISYAFKIRTELETKWYESLKIKPITSDIVIKAEKGLIPKLYPEIETVQEPEYSKLLNAKIIFIGPTGVGKTSLIRYIMGKELSLFEPSTTGLDIFYKKIETTIKDYETQLCFWDLSGQPNLSTFNEINIHDASIIILVFDITNPPTFKELKKTYLGMVKNARKLENNFIFLVGNKIDLGGRALPKKKIDQFVIKNNFYKFFETSASTGEHMDDLLGSIRQAIDWSEMVKNIKPEILNIVGKEIKKLRAHEKIMEISEFMSIFVDQSYQISKVEIQASLKQFASQDLIILGRSERFIVLDPEFIAKKESELSKIAANNNGRLHIDDYLKKWKLTRTQLKMLFKFLEEENYCYRLSKRIWIFSNVPRDIETKIDEYTQNILDSDPKTLAYKIQGAGEFIFNHLIANIAKEFDAPETGGGFFGDTSALWRIGRAPDLSALFINYMSSEDGGVIRFKAGGGKGEDLLKRIDELAFQIFTAYAPEFEKIRFIEEYM